MRQVRIAGYRQAELETVPMPSLRDGWALVKILAAPLCAEYKLFRSGRPFHYIGHEAAGVVVERAAGASVDVGDRVVVMPQYPCGRCRHCTRGEFIYCKDNLDLDAGALAEYIAKPSWLLAPIPDDVTIDVGALACCGLGPSFGAEERAGVDGSTTLLVTGLGPVGLGAVVNGVHRGARVFGVDQNPFRAQLARDLGAAGVLDPRDDDVLQQVRAACGGDGPDVGVDCSGVPTAHRLLIDAVRSRGVVVLVGETMDPTPIRASPDMIRKGMTIMGSWHYALPDFPQVMDVLRTFAGVERLITHRFPLDQIQTAFEVSEEQRCGKVVLHPFEEAPQ